MRQECNKQQLILESQFSESARLLSSLISDSHANVRILEWAGFVALENKQWVIAENVFSSLLERRNKPLDLIGLAKALKKQSRLDEAEECYLAALERIAEPCALLFIAYKALGEMYLLKSNFPMAEEFCNKASTLNPSCQSLIFYRAILRLKEKNYIEAEKHFQKFVQTDLNSAKAWLGLALTRKALGDEDMALACLYRSLDIDPQYSRALELKKRWLFSNFSLTPPSSKKWLLSSLSFSA